MSAPRQLVTLALRKMFAEHSTGLKVYSGFAPDTPGYPFNVLHSIPGGGYSGPALVDPAADVAYVYQLDSVGTRVDQAEKLRDEQHERFAGRGPSGAFVVELEVIPGFAWVDRIADDDVPGGVDVERVPTGTICTAVSRYTVVLTPN